MSEQGHRDLEKEAQFITMVQTALVVWYSDQKTDGTAPLCRPMWAIEHLEEAYKVARNIPPDETAATAAEAFMTWLIERDKLTDRDRTILSILLNEQE